MAAILLIFLGIFASSMALSIGNINVGIPTLGLPGLGNTDKPISLEELGITISVGENDDENDSLALKRLYTFRANDDGSISSYAITGLNIPIGSSGLLTGGSTTGSGNSGGGLKGLLRRIQNADRGLTEYDSEEMLKLILAQYTNSTGDGSVTLGTDLGFSITIDGLEETNSEDNLEEFLNTLFKNITYFGGVISKEPGNNAGKDDNILKFIEEYVIRPTNDGSINIQTNSGFNITIQGPTQSGSNSGAGSLLEQFQNQLKKLENSVAASNRPRGGSGNRENGLKALYRRLENSYEEYAEYDEEYILDLIYDIIFYTNYNRTVFLQTDSGFDITVQYSDDNDDTFKFIQEYFANRTSSGTFTVQTGSGFNITFDGPSQSGSNGGSLAILEQYSDTIRELINAEGAASNGTTGGSENRENGLKALYRRLENRIDEYTGEPTDDDILDEFLFFILPEIIFMGNVFARQPFSRTTGNIFFGFTPSNE